MENLSALYEELCRLLAPYEKRGALVKRTRGDGKMELISHKEVEIGGRKRKDLSFVSLEIQKNFVGFYYMPVYMNPVIRARLKPDLLRCLKGKACFHIKKHDPQLFAEISEALEMGYACFEKFGWV
jgi:hypothetical protein